jgi:CheY-like chemotaxis protein
LEDPLTDSRIAPPVRVLVANGDAALALSAAELLAKKGFAVELADTSEDAFQKVRLFRPDVIFYDMSVPGYDALEALTLISKTRSGKDGFLFASASSRSSDAADSCRAAGAWDFIPGPVTDAVIFEAASAIKRHLNRPREVPHKARHTALKVSFARCPRPGCQSQMALFTLKEGGSVASKKDEFETPIYISPSGAEEFLDYNLVSVAVCPECYFALDASVPAKAGAPPKASLAAEPVLFAIAAEADETLFTEDRSPAAALIAYRLAIENHQALPDDSPDGANRLADLLFKAASVAHRTGDERLRDRFFADAEKVCAAALKMSPSAPVYRCACRLVALYVFFARDLDAAKTFKMFGRFEKPTTGRMKPRDSRVLETYRTASANILANKHFHRRARYLV